jgi:hypothetical protein
LGWQYTLFGVICEELKDKADGNIAGAVAMLALGQCSADLAPAPNAQSAAEKASSVMGCIGSSISAVQKGALTFVTKKIPGADGARAQKILKPVLSSLKMVAGAYTKVSPLLKVFTTVGDMTLPVITRQFLYQPSVAAIKEAAAKKKAAATTTKFVTLDPWRDGSLSAVASTSEDAGRSCSGSEIAPRSDAFRCSTGDPCFQSPTTKTDFLCFALEVWRQAGLALERCQPG